MKYSVFVRGSNYLLDLDEKGVREFSFYIWKCVYADIQEDAER